MEKVDLDKVMECKFTLEELNLFNNIIVCCYARNAFKMDELENVDKAWKAIKKYLPEKDVNKNKIVGHKTEKLEKVEEKVEEEKVVEKKKVVEKEKEVVQEC